MFSKIFIYTKFNMNRNQCFSTFFFFFFKGNSFKMFSCLYHYWFIFILKLSYELMLLYLSIKSGIESNKKLIS